METLDNSIDADLNKVIIWQYDNSPNLIALIDSFKAFFRQSTEEFWNSLSVQTFLADPDSVDDYGLALWGAILDTERPIVNYKAEDEDTASDHLISSDFYRTLLLARLHAMQKPATLQTCIDYTNEVFGNGNITVTDNGDMSLTYSIADGKTLSLEMTALIEQFPKVAFVWPAGVYNGEKSSSPMFWLAENSTSTSSDKPASDVNGGGLDNSSFTWIRNQYT